MQKIVIHIKLKPMSKLMLFHDYCNMFMIHVENLAEDLNENTSLYKRYMDDIPVIRERKEDMNC